VSVPAIGLTFSDHLQPGSSREAMKSPRVTTPTLPCSNVLVSSGESRFLLWILSEAMMSNLLSILALLANGS
jgi:hypothetical protein